MDEAALAAAVTRHLGGDATVEHLRRLSGGASRETWAFDGTVAGERAELVLRRDPAPAAAGPLDRSAEAEVIQAAHDAGVLAPRVRFVLALGIVYLMTGKPGSLATALFILLGAIVIGLLCAVGSWASRPGGSKV